MTPFGKYFLLERINVGGMAEVYKAKTVGVEGFEKIVAIKRILPSVAEDEEFIRMFVDEAKITSQLNHANLAQTFDLGKIDDTFYIAMEYVPGKDLRAVFERLKRRGGKMPLPLAAWVMSRVCEGLDYAHRKRDSAGRDLHIVHRDVSPQNIILSYEGEVKLIDFGIAKAANKITKTQAGILKGKFGYMSPEQVRGLPLDGRSDIFAAGVVLYELCTGERLFTGSSDFSVLEKVQQARVTPPSQIDPKIPLKLERVMLRALAREPEDRYQQAADLAADLTRFLLETQQKAVTRDDIAAFMRAAFPEDEQQPARRPPPKVQQTVPGPQRKPAPRVDEPRSSPPLLPPSITADLDDDVVGLNDPDRTITGPVPDGPPAEIIVRSKMGDQGGGTIRPARGDRVPRRSDAAPEDTDGPTRPMSMNELAAAEREYAQRESRSVVLEEDTPTPQAPPQAFAVKSEPTQPRLEDQKTQVKPAPHVQRMQVNKPTLVGEDPMAADESTNSAVRKRARTVRGIQIGIIVVAIGIAAWALFSTPKRQQQPRLVDADQAAAASQKPAQPAPPPPAPPNAVTVLSSPPGAQVYVDGEKKGVTPAYLATLDPTSPHAISVEKRCYRSWQLALPAQSGPRQLAATLQPAPGACPGTHLETAGMPAPPDLPDDVPTTLGFLNLGSRPSAQVLIDGVDIGQTTPLVAWPLKNGAHRVRLVAGKAAKDLPLEIQTGETHSEIVDLTPPPSKKRRGRR